MTSWLQKQAYHLEPNTNYGLDLLVMKLLKKPEPDVTSKADLNL